jgi:hypothetical protein
LNAAKGSLIFASTRGTLATAPDRAEIDSRQMCLSISHLACRFAWRSSGQHSQKASAAITGGMRCCRLRPEQSGVAGDLFCGIFVCDACRHETAVMLDAQLFPEPEQ